MRPSNPLFMFTSFTCRRTAPLLWALPDELSARDSARLAAHLAACSACRKEASEMRAMEQALRRDTPAPLAPSADLWKRIEAEIAPVSSAPSQPGQIHRAKPFVPALGGMAWAGSLAIVAAGGAWMAYGGGFLHRTPAASPAVPGASASIAANADASNAPRPFASVTLLPAPTADAAPRTALAKTMQAAKTAKPAVFVSARPAAPTAAAPHPPRRISAPSRQIARATVAPTHEKTVRVPVATLADAALEAALQATKSAAKTAPVFAATVSVPPAPTSEPLDFAPSPADRSAPMAGAISAEGETFAEANQPASALPIFSSTSPPAQSTFVSAKPAGVFYAYAAADAGANAAAFSGDNEAPTTAPMPRSRRPISVADAAVQTQRQQALFSYGRP